MQGTPDAEIWIGVVRSIDGTTHGSQRLRWLRQLTPVRKVADRQPRFGRHRLAQGQLPALSLGHQPSPRMTESLAGLFAKVDCVHRLAGRTGIRTGWAIIVEAYAMSNVLTPQRLTKAPVASPVPKVTITPTFCIGRPPRRCAPIGRPGRSHKRTPRAIGIPRRRPRGPLGSTLPRSEFDRRSVCP
jgi:hypothetical protein